MWRTNAALRPYFADVKLLIENKVSIELFQQPYLPPKVRKSTSNDHKAIKNTSGSGGSNSSSHKQHMVPVHRNTNKKISNNEHNHFKHVVSVEDLSFIHFPIEDCNVVEDDRVLQLAKQLVYDISKGEVIYLHCWGGHGRTGTVVCLMLHLMYGVRLILFYVMGSLILHITFNINNICYVYMYI